MRLNINDSTRIRDYVRAKEAEMYTPCVINNQGMFRMVKGRLVPEAEFQASNQVKIRPLTKSVENPCKKYHAFL